MRIGVIFTAWQTEDMVNESLRPWIQARHDRLGDNDYLICAVSVPFEGFSQDEKLDDTVVNLRVYSKDHVIHHHIWQETPMKETEARGQALRWLLDRGCDITIMVDSDEFYQLAEIERIFSFVASRPSIAAFRGSLKNYVGIPDDKTYLVQPFTPMRIHRVQHGSYQANSFWDDNNVLYRGTITRDFKRDIDLPVGQIPKVVAWTKHLSWPNSIRSQRKIDYQLNGRKWPTCSFGWDDARGGLIWNPAMAAPETAREE